MSIKINYSSDNTPNLIYIISHENPITGEVDEHRPIFLAPVQWTNGNFSFVSIWQVSPDGWNYYDDCEKNGRYVENKDLAYLLWNYGISDNKPFIEDVIRSEVEWI